MNKLYYCSDCKRIVKGEEKCDYCNSENVKELLIGAPVNIIGSKLKGKVLKIKDGVVRLLVRDESNSKFIKEYEANTLKKVI